MSARQDDPRIISPEVDYSHVLVELSVNRKDPCEVVRELISNAYDAHATNLFYFPLLQYKGFVFFDDGDGMSSTQEVRGISPYRAFYSIGKSTKLPGQCIGYKCQGSKLCFACKKFLMITRCEGESAWRHFAIDDPRANLRPGKDITPTPTSTPWDELARQVFLAPNDQTNEIQAAMDQDFFAQTFQKGSMIVVTGFEAEDFARHFATLPDAGGGCEGTYLWNYIRFCTRHGDVRLLDHTRTGFKLNAEQTLKQSTSPATFNLWVGGSSTGDGYKQIPAGFHYLPKPLEKPLGPLQVSALKHARFYSRHAGNFRHEGNLYSWILAVDGHRRCLDDYTTLGRSKSIRSGISLLDQRGTFLCAAGIKICRYDGLFAGMSGLEILAESGAIPHYLFLLDGPFKLVTDRNSVTTSDIAILESKAFTDKLRQQVYEAIVQGGEDTREDGIDHNAIVRSLIQRLSEDIQERMLDRELSKIEKAKGRIAKRGRFEITSGSLKGRLFVFPDHGEENWVGALYTLFSQFVKPDSKYASLWLRPINMSGVSIDAVALSIGESGVGSATSLKGLEYKLSFSHKNGFNHPLFGVHTIVCWEFSEPPEEGARIDDDYDCCGLVQKKTGMSPSIVYEIHDLQRSNGTGHREGVIVNVVSLKELIKASFKAKWTPPSTT